MTTVVDGQSLSDEFPEEEGIIPVVPSDPVAISGMLNTVHERLLHPKTTRQVYAATFLLNSLTRETLDQEAEFSKEKITPLAYAKRRLAVFELGIVALLACSDFNMEAKERFYEGLEHERRVWDDRVWELRIEQEMRAGETTHFPLGFLQPEEIKPTTPR